MRLRLPWILFNDYTGLRYQASMYLQHHKTTYFIFSYPLCSIGHKINETVLDSRHILKCVTSHKIHTFILHISFGCRYINQSHTLKKRKRKRKGRKEEKKTRRKKIIITRRASITTIQNITLTPQ